MQKSKFDEEYKARQDILKKISKSKLIENAAMITSPSRSAFDFGSEFGSKANLRSPASLSPKGSKTGNNSSHVDLPRID